MSLTIAAALKLFPVEKKASAGILDAEVLLAYVLGVKRSYLYAWPQKKLSDEQEKKFVALLDRCLQGEPVPYLVGHQEFWSLDFVVTHDVLIPRPETELLVELLLGLPLEKTLPMNIADLGTGSGAIALALGHERPGWIIHATDKSTDALQVAKLNAERLNIPNVAFYQGNWCAALPKVLFDAIIANPPYIAEDDGHLQQDGVSFEPVGALISGQDGLEDIRQIIHEASSFLKPGACLMLEHGYDQAARVRDLLEQAGYKNSRSVRDLSGIERVTLGWK